MLGLGVFFLTLFSLSTGGGAGVQAARTLFGSIFGLGAGEARLAALVAILATGATLALARPLLFISLAPEVAIAKGVPARLLSVGFVALLGVVAAGATEAIGALLLLGLFDRARGGGAPPDGQPVPGHRARRRACGGLDVGWPADRLRGALPAPQQRDRHAGRRLLRRCGGGRCSAAPARAVRRGAAWSRGRECRRRCD